MAQRCNHRWVLILNVLVVFLLMFGLEFGHAQSESQEDVPAGAEAEAEPGPERVVDPRADSILKQMGEYLASLPRMALEAEETFDEIPEGQPRIQLSNLRRIAVERRDGWLPMHRAIP